MTGQDVALLILLQVAIVAAAALAVWTAWVAGIAEGERRARENSLGARLARMGKALRAAMAAIPPPVLRIPDLEPDGMQRLRAQAMLMERAAITVQRTARNLGRITAL